MHEYGLLRPSFIPAAEVAALRQRTRYRKRLIEQRTAEGQRLSKVLEDAGIKIDSVASRLLGKSGREMVEALIAGERNPRRLADLARGVLRRKTDDLQMACDGRFTGGHGQMCRLHLDAYDHLTAKIAALDALIAETAAPFAAVIARLALVANRVMSPPVSATITSAVRWPIPGIVISRAMTAANGAAASAISASSSAILAVR